MVSVLAYNSDNPSSISAEAYNYSAKILVEKITKEARDGPFT